MNKVKRRHSIKTQNPWQLLVIGSFFLLGAVLWFCQRGTEMVSHFVCGAFGESPHNEFEMQSPQSARVYGILALIIALLCFRMYLKLRAEFTGWRWSDLRVWLNRDSNKASDATSKPAPGADSSAIKTEDHS